MLSLVISGQASVIFEIGHLWFAFFFDAENAFFASVGHAQYFTFATVTALKFIDKASRCSRNPGMPVSKTTPCLRCGAAQRSKILPRLDDPLVDQLFRRAQVVRKGGAALHATTPTTTAIG